MTMVQVEVKVEVDIIEVMEDKHVHKVGEEVTREVTKKFRGMVGW